MLHPSLQPTPRPARETPASRRWGLGLALIALVASAQSANALHRARTPSDGYRPVGEVSSTSEPQISPDGRWLVFVVCESSDACYLASSRRFGEALETPVELDGPLTSGGFFGGGLEFEITGDSRRVVYEGTADPDAERDLWSVAIDGSSAPVRLNAPLLAGEGISNWQVTEDGQQVVFELNRPGTDQLLRCAIDGAGGPTVLDEGSSIRSFLFPAASGSPRLLYFIDTDADNQLETLTIYLSSTLPFAIWAGELPSTTNLGTVAFTPDGGTVVLEADMQTDGVVELWSIRTDSANSYHKLSQTLVAGGNVTHFELSSDGRAVYRADAVVDERFELWSAPVDDSAAPILLSGTLVAGGDVQSLRVAGEWAAYLADASVDARNELWSVPADGHEAPTRRSDTVPAGRDVTSFQVTPSGTRLVYRANLDTVSRFDLYWTTTFGITSHVQLTNRNPFAPDPYSVRTYTLSPDSERVAFAVEPDANWDGTAMEQSLVAPVTSPEILLDVTGADASDYFLDYLPDARGLSLATALSDSARREAFLLDEAIFVDGFASGNRAAWSASVP